MKIHQFVVDAFASRLFEGNPAAVCPLDEWLDDELMQQIAAENNLSETAFFVPAEGGFELRWFTPTREVDLCGHATLASAHVLFTHLGHRNEAILFQTRGGDLRVSRDDPRLTMDLPAREAASRDLEEAVVRALGATPKALHAADDYLAVFASETEILELKPDMNALKALDLRGVIVTAPGEKTDFVSRFFAPKAGIPEDPVTGSAHCALAPYWAKQMGKTLLTARQVSTRGGDVLCELKKDRVLLSGTAVTFSEGTLHLPGYH